MNKSNNSFLLNKENHVIITVVERDVYILLIEGAFRVSAFLTFSRFMF